MTELKELKELKGEESLHLSDMGWYQDRPLRNIGLSQALNFLSVQNSSFGGAFGEKKIEVSLHSVLTLADIFQEYIRTGLWTERDTTIKWAEKELGLEECTTDSSE